MSSSNTSTRVHSIPLDILDDLAARFIVNLPDEERTDPIRLCFQLELAHWFYLDEYAKSSSRLRPCSLREFAEHVFNHVQCVAHHAHSVDEMLQEWKEYKLRVPTYGAIIMNDDLSKVLLVQSYGSRSSWGFPKGKVNECEAPHVCAIREVYEETGFDIANMISSEHYLTSIINDQTVTLFLVPFVKENTKFVPRTKCEIRDIQWFPISLLPTSKRDEMRPNPLGITPSSLFTVIPFVKALNKWASVYKRGHFHHIHTPIHKSNSSTNFSSGGNNNVTRSLFNGESGKKGKTELKTPSNDRSCPTNVLAPPPPPRPVPVVRSVSEISVFKEIEAWKDFKFNMREIRAALET